MRRLFGAASVILFSGVALAATMPRHDLSPSKKAPPTKLSAPKEDKKLTAKEQKAYKDALVQGRKLHKAKKYKDAVAAFQKALDVSPDDPRALSELGYAAYFDKDFTKAEEATRKSIDRSSDPNIRGASLYNLGLIHEALGKKDEAIDDYTQSLEARPNSIVRKALAKLDEKAAARFDPLNPIAMMGPYKTLDDWCKEAKADNNLGGEITLCSTKGELFENYRKVLGALKYSGAYKEIAIVAAAAPMLGGTELTGAGEVMHHLAIRTDKGWYIEAGGLYVYNPGAFGIFQEAYLRSIEIKDAITGGEPEVIYTYSNDQSDHDMAGAIRYYGSTDETIVCGIGTSGAPSCTNPIVTKSTSGVDTSLWDEAELGPVPEKSSESTWNVTLSFTADGKLDLQQGTLVKIKSLPKENKANLGTRALFFP